MADERIKIDAKPRRIVVHMLMSAVEPTDCEQLDKLLRAELASAPRDVVVDCTHIKFLPSLAVGTLVSLRRETSKDGHSFILAGLTPHIRQVLVLSRLDRLFSMSETLEAALATPATAS